MVLEGGYNPDALAQSVRNTCFALTGSNLPDGTEPEPPIQEPDIQEILNEIKEIHDL
jgi:acetoin utilization deacetylase AcuC-like enzyme